MKSIIVQVTYSQLAIHKRKMERPLNAWSNAHVKQGFSWRAGSVSFKTLEEDMELCVQVSVVENFPPIQECSVQVIDVPLEIGVHGIEVGGITSSEPVAVPQGNYELRIEFLSDLQNALVWLSKNEMRRFLVHKLHAVSEIPLNLDLEAAPA